MSPWYMPCWRSMLKSAGVMSCLQEKALHSQSCTLVISFWNLFPYFCSFKNGNMLSLRDSNRVRRVMAWDCLTMYVRDNSLLNTLERYAFQLWEGVISCRWDFVSLQFFFVYLLFLKHVYLGLANKYGSSPSVTGAWYAILWVSSEGLCFHGLETLFLSHNNEWEWGLKLVDLLNKNVRLIENTWF